MIGICWLFAIVQYESQIVSNSSFEAATHVLISRSPLPNRLIKRILLQMIWKPDISYRLSRNDLSVSYGFEFFFLSTNAVCTPLDEGMRSSMPCKVASYRLQDDVSLDKNPFLYCRHGKVPKPWSSSAEHVELSSNIC
jgi:hypothetical protein